VIPGLVLEREAFHIIARRMFLKVYLSDGKPLKKRWPEDAFEVETMYLVAENIGTGWEMFKNELYCITSVFF
jgi:hypothetical protein